MAYALLDDVGNVVTSTLYWLKCLHGDLHWSLNMCLLQLKLKQDMLWSYFLLNLNS